ncbi:MAG: hypothetical protein ABIJ21_02775 [Nanoarchaeota archaeon]
MHFVIKKKWKSRHWEESRLFDTKAYLDLTTTWGRKEFQLESEENGGRYP